MRIIKSKYSSKELNGICEKAKDMVEKKLVDKIDKIQVALNAVIGFVLIITSIVLLITNDAIRNDSFDIFAFLALVLMVASVPFIVCSIVHERPEDSFIGQFYKKKGHILCNPLAKVSFFEEDHPFWFASGHSMLWRLAKWIEFCEKVYPEEVQDDNAEVQVIRHNDLLLVVKGADPHNLEVVDGLEVSNWMEEAMTEDVMDFSHFDDRIEKCLQAVSMTI